MATEKPKKAILLNILKVIGLAIVGFFAFVLLGRRKDPGGNNEIIKKAEDDIAKERDNLAGKPSDTDIKNKHSTIVPVLLVLFLFSQLHGQYIVYDPEDGVNRDYGTCENYGEAMNELYMTNKSKVQSLAIITNSQGIIITELKKELKREKRERRKAEWRAYGTAIVAVAVFIAGWMAGQKIRTVQPMTIH